MSAARYVLEQPAVWSPVITIHRNGSGCHGIEDGMPWWWAETFHDDFLHEWVARREDYTLCPDCLPFAGVVAP